MPKQKLNVEHPQTGNRVIGIMDTDTKKVLLAKDKIYSLGYLKNVAKKGINYFGTYSKGKKIQEDGKFKGLETSN